MIDVDLAKELGLRSFDEGFPAKKKTALEE